MTKYIVRSIYIKHQNTRIFFFNIGISTDNNFFITHLHEVLKSLASTVLSTNTTYKHNFCSFFSVLTIYSTFPNIKFIRYRLPESTLQHVQSRVSKTADV